MPVSDTLKNFRKGGYGGGQEQDPGTTSPAAGRVLSLTEDEKKELDAALVPAGEEITCMVTGKLEGDHLQVMSIQGSPDMTNADAAQVAGVAPQMTTPSVQPSPS